MAANDSFASLDPCKTPQLTLAFWHLLKSQVALLVVGVPHVWQCVETEHLGQDDSYPHESSGAIAQCNPTNQLNHFCNITKVFDLQILSRAKFSL
jgi:hypothetical protein